MLNFTKNQTLILEIFFNQPDKAFYLRELARLVGKQPGVFQRDINKLVEENILSSYYQANSRYFELNKNHPLFPELKSIFFKTVGIEGTLKKELKELKGIKEAFIYGSFAQKREKSSSDIDILVIGSVNEDGLIDKITPLEKKFAREINYTLITEKEFQKKIKENNSFLENVLSKKRIKLV
jgi:predicted nucleotidyltransferase